MKTKNSHSGFTLIEVILALAILTIFMGAAISLYLSAGQGTTINTDYVRASFLLREGLNGVRAIRDTNFLSLENGTFGLTRGAASYDLSAQPDVTDSVFTRTITISDAYRDANGNLAGSGDIGASVKSVSVQVSFTGLGGITRSVSASTYLADWASAEIVHTLLPDFNSPDVTNVISVSIPAPPVNNGGLKLDTSYIQNGFYSSADLGDHANDVAGSGNYAYVATDKDNKGLSVVNISDPSALVLATQVDVGGKGNGVAISGTIAAAAVEKDNAGLAFVDITNPPAATRISRLDIGGNGRQVLISGSTTFVTTNKANGGLVIVNSTNPQAPTVTKTVNIGGEGAALAKYGNFLLVGVKDSGGINVYNVQNPSLPVLVQQFALGNGYANGIAIDFPYVYASTEHASKDVYIARMNDSGILTLLSSLSLTSKGHTNDVMVTGTTINVGTDDNNKGIVVIDVTDPATPKVLEYKDVSAKARGLTAIGSYIGVATDTKNEGFVLVGAGNKGFASSGTYTSAAIDTGSVNPEYLSVGFLATIPPGGSVSIQLRSAATAGALDTATWSNPYTESPSVLSLLPKRYVQYKVNFTSDSNSSPLVDVINIEFLP